MKSQYIKLGTANFTGDCEKDFLDCKSGDVINQHRNGKDQHIGCRMLHDFSIEPSC